jgi:DNA-binding SARP family transcriptional activator/tetratricopeptide (TPR) repeat protein
MDVDAQILDQQEISIHLFGPLRVRCGERDITPKSRKARALIAILLLSDEWTATRDQLVGLLWGDRGDEQARASLRQALTELRGSGLGEAGLLTIVRDYVRFEPGPSRIETAILAAAAARGDLQVLRELLPACALPLLHGLDGVCPAFDEWLAVERTRQRDLVIEASLRAVEAELGAGNAADVVGVIGELERLDPGNEFAARLGMRADALAGQRGALNRRYRRLCDTLAREFGAAPSEETNALFHELMAASTAHAPIAVPPPAPTREPPEAPPPVGDDGPPLLQLSSFRYLGAEDSGNLAIAIRAEIMAGLARHRDLRLAAESDAHQPTGYRLAADIRRTDSALIITPQLLRHDGELVWADRLQVPAEDIEPGVELIVSRIVATAMPAMMSDVVQSIRPRAAGGLYSRYLLAQESAFRPADHAQALEAARELEAIIAQEPRFASAMLALARIYDTEFVWTRANSSGPKERARAAELSKRALALDRDNVSAWTHVGWAHLWHGRWAAAEQAFLAALTLNPFNVARLLEVAYGRIFLGDLDGAADLMARCVRIEPRPGDALLGDRGLLNLIRRDFDAASDDFQQVLAPDLSMKLHAAAAAALGGHPLGELRDRAEEAIARIFPDQRLPASADLVLWLHNTHPFRDDEHRRTLVEGVSAAFR